MERHVAEPQANRPQLFGRQCCLSHCAHHAIPKIALIRRQIQAAQLRPQPRGPRAEVARMDAQVIDQTSRVPRGNFSLQTSQLPPERGEDAFLPLLLAAVVLVWAGQRQFQRLFKMAADEQPRDKAPRPPPHPYPSPPGGGG